MLAALFSAPSVGSEGALCADPCIVPSHAVGYLPPLVVIESGTSVVYTSLDTVHIHVDTPTLSGGDCFLTASKLASPADPVAFVIAGGALHASVADGPPVRCDGAIGLAEGGFILPMHCTLHPQMRGTLLVLPA